MNPSGKAESRIAWAATLIFAFYCLWVGGVAWQEMPLLVAMQEGLGVEGGISPMDAFLAHHSWLYAGVAVAVAAALIAKELTVIDKRRSTMITCLIATTILVVVDATRLLIMRPFAILMSKLTQ